MKLFTLMTLLFASTFAHAGTNTDNKQNVFELQTLFFGAINTNITESRTFTGNDGCILTVKTTRSGIDFAFDKDPNDYRVSVSGKTSENFKMAKTNTSISSSQLALSEDEESTNITKETLSLTYVLDPITEKADIKSITITNIGSSNSDGDIKNPVFKPSDLVSKTCTF